MPLYYTPPSPSTSDDDFPRLTDLDVPSSSPSPPPRTPSPVYPSSALLSHFQSSQKVRKPSVDSQSSAALAAVTRYLNDPDPEPGACFGPIRLDDLRLFTDRLHNFRYTYNPYTRTIEFKMSGTFHSACVWWLSDGYPVMLEEDFVVRPRTTARSRLRAGPAIQPLEFKTEENKTFTTFAGTIWAGMRRTPDWCLYTLTADARLCKPRIVLEVNYAQPLARYSGASRRENLRDRAVGWLTTTYGVTKAVILVNLARRNGMVDCAGVQRPWVTSLVVTVELWRMVADVPACVEKEEFVVGGQADAGEVEGGLMLRPEDVYDAPLPHQNGFVLEYAWLCQHLLKAWPLARSQWVEENGGAG